MNSTQDEQDYLWLTKTKKKSPLEDSTNLKRS